MKVLAVVTGVLTGLIGLYAMFVPFQTFLGIGWVLGILLLVNGIETVIEAFKGEKKDIWKCILGILEIVVGIIFAVSGISRFLTDVFVAYMIGAFVVIYGGVAVWTGAKVWKESKGSGILKIVAGILAVVAGIIALAHPALTMISVGYIIAFSLLIQGINMVILALSIKKKK